MSKHLKILLYIAVFGVACGCGQLRNDNDQTQLICGDKPESYALVQIESTEGVEAFLSDGNDIKQARYSSKGCILVEAEDRASQLIVRDRMTRQRSLRLDLATLPPGLMRFPLNIEANSTRLATELKCPSATVAVGRKFLPALRRFESTRVVASTAQLTLKNDAQEIVLQRRVILGPEVPAVDLNLADGTYHLDLLNFDAFDAPDERTNTAPESCVLRVDNNRPVIELEQKGLPLVQGSASILKIAPGAQLSFSSIDQNSVQIFTCLKRRTDELIQVGACRDDEYKAQSNTLNAPDQGAWDLYAFATDAVGNRSEITHIAFFVYHDTIINEIHSLSRTVSDYRRIANEFQAFKTYQRLVSLARSLSLRSEILDVYWQLVGSYLWASTNRHLLTEQVFAEDEHLQTNRVAIHPTRDEWAVGGDSHGYIYRDNELVVLNQSYSAFYYISRQRLAGVRPKSNDSSSTSIDIIDDGKVVDTLDFKGRIETAVFDKPSQQMILVFGNKVTFADLDSHSQQSYPLPFDPLEFSNNTKLTIVADSPYFFISRKKSIVRFNFLTQKSLQFADQDLCDVRDYQVLSGSEILYTGDPSSGNRCLKLNRVVWANAEDEQPTEILPGSANPYLGVSSFFLTKVDDKPYLLYLKDKIMYAQDMSQQNAEPVFFSNAIDGTTFLENPNEANTVYVAGLDQVARYKLRLDRGILRSEISLVNLEARGRLLRSVWLTPEPGQFYLFGSTRVERFTFDVAPELTDPPFPCARLCSIVASGDYAFSQSDEGTLVWADFQSGIRKTHESKQKIFHFSALPNNEVLYTTTDKKAFIWRAKTNELLELGSFELDNLWVQYFPIVDLVTLSTMPVDAPTNSQNIARQIETIVLRRDNGLWKPATGKRKGLPLPPSPQLAVLPLLQEGNRPQTLALEILNQQGTSLHTLELVNPVQSRVPIFYSLSIARRSLSIDPSRALIYTTGAGRLEAFDLYNGQARSVPLLPEGYKATIFYGSDWIGLEVIDSAVEPLWAFMNVLSGVRIPVNDPLPRASQNTVIQGATIRKAVNIRDSSGEIFEFRGDLKTTSDPFVLLFEFRTADGSQLASVRVDPNWIDAQLRKTPLYTVKN